MFVDAGAAAAGGRERGRLLGHGASGRQIPYTSHRMNASLLSQVQRLQATAETQAVQLPQESGLQTQEQVFKPENSARFPQVQQLQADAKNAGYSDLWCTWTPGSNVQYRILRPSLLRAGAAAAGGREEGGLLNCGAH